MQLLKRERVVKSNQWFESVSDRTDSPKKRWCSERSTCFLRFPLCWFQAELQKQLQVGLNSWNSHFLLLLFLITSAPSLYRRLIYGHQNHLMEPQNSRYFAAWLFTQHFTDTQLNVSEFTALKMCLLSGFLSPLHGSSLHKEEQSKT